MTKFLEGLEPRRNNSLLDRSWGIHWIPQQGCGSIDRFFALTDNWLTKIKFQIPNSQIHKDREEVCDLKGAMDNNPDETVEDDGDVTRITSRVSFLVNIFWIMHSILHFLTKYDILFF